MLVNAGPTVTDVDAAGRIRRSWSFERLVQYKGEPGFDRLWSSGDEALCGAYLVEGEQYLVSAADDGRVSFCSTWRVGSTVNAGTAIDVLNAYISGRIPELVEPWSYTEGSEICLLNHQLTDGGAYLQFHYRFKEPEHPDARQYPYPVPYTRDGGSQARPPIEDRGVHPSYTPGFMNLRVRFPSGEYVSENSGTVVIGEKHWRTRRTLMEAPWAIPYEVVDEKEAREILAALQDASSVAVKWNFRQLPRAQQYGYPDHPEASASTPYLFFGDAIARFQECLDRGLRQDF